MKDTFYFLKGRNMSIKDQAPLTLLLENKLVNSELKNKTSNIRKELLNISSVKRSNN
jgi:hypothetical protein